MHTVEFTTSGIRIGEEEYPLWSGSFHYWRSEREHWPRILDRAREMGFRIVESYVPWGVHETTPGAYDFGEEDPRKDLKHFLRLCRERNLFVLLRPGPHINAELDCFGLPERIVFQKEFMARSPWGTPVTYPYATRPFPIPSYASAAFREEVFRYFDAVYAQIEDHLYPRGPVVALQSDNEYCHFFRDAAYTLDYSQAAVERYRAHILEQYGTAEEVGAAYGESLDSIGALQPPTGFDPARPRKCRDWVRFKEQDITATVGMISAYWRGRGITLPLFHNVAYQYYTPIDLAALEREAVDVAGIDIYLSPRDWRELRRRCRYLAGTSRLPYVPEFLSGVWFDNPATPTVAQQEFLTLYCLMQGLKAVNFYMLVERDRWQGCPLTVDGEYREEYRAFYTRLIQLMERYQLHRPTRAPQALLLKNHELARERALRSEADLSPLTSNAFVNGAAPPRALFQPENAALPWKGEADTGSDWWSEPWLDRCLDDLTRQGIDCNLSDTHLPLEKLRDCELLCVSAFGRMSAGLQEKLAAYVSGGGRLVLSQMPDTDLDGAPCGVLAGAARKYPLSVSLDTMPPPSLEAALEPLEGTLEYMLHNTPGGKLLFAANTASEKREGSVALAGRALRPVWGGEGDRLRAEDGSFHLALPPYTVSIWEVMA